MHERTGAAASLDSQEIEFDRRRAQRAFDLLMSRLPTARTVLDIGGGDGRLLAPFLHAGLHCHVLDHNPRPISGVKRIGATWDDVPADLQFDLMLCNHVLEHVADPVGFAQRALGHLAPGGHVYFEIPLEIWGTIPINQDPVTHVNFFQRRTLCHTLRRAGYEVRRSRTAVGTYAQWRLPVSWAVARRAQEARPDVSDAVAAAHTRRLLERPWHTRAYYRYWLQPQVDGLLPRLQSLPARTLSRLSRALRGS
jgi:SAM-dependent methyltransferase